MSVKTSFSIKDLQNLSGVKAHTIRIWEKRYNLLQPERSDTNIRTYDIFNLQKILNVTLLNNNGFKVSEIAKLDEVDLFRKAQELGTFQNNGDHAINSFKVSMLNFDANLFDKVYHQLLEKYSFEYIFLDVFFKLLQDIGVLWQTKTISVAHEHFISNLIKQKLLIKVEKLERVNFNKKKTFVLFLPVNEIHELGLLYLHYGILKKGYRSVYLGASVPIDDLVDIQTNFNSITYISFFTVEPSLDNLSGYLSELSNKVLINRNEKVFIAGRKINEIDQKKIPSNITFFENMVDLLDQFE